MDPFITQTERGPRFEMRSRPWGLMALGAVLALFFLAPSVRTADGGRAPSPLLALVVFVMCSLLGWVSRRRTLIADDEGLRARAFVEWMSYRWDQVLDVSWVAIPGSRTGPNAFIEVRPTGSAGAVPGPNWPDEMVAFWFIGRRRARVAGVALADVAAHYGVPAQAIWQEGWGRVRTYRGGSSADER